MRGSPSLIIASLMLSAVSAGTLLAAPACVADATTLCLQGDRFEVRLDWANFPGNEFSLQPPSASGSGNAVELEDDTGYFWFANSRNQDNVEVLVKVLDGCSINDRFWVFAAGVTNVELSLRVTDVVSNQSRVYGNPPRVPLQAVQDTDAFQVCPMPVRAPADGTPETIRSLAGGTNTSRSAERSPSVPRTAFPCAATPTALCLNQDRFRVEVEFDAGFTSGSATLVPVVNSSESGLIWFFHADNWEMLVKVLDGRAINGRFWVFAGSLSSVEYTLTVTDTLTDTTRTYFNPAGSSTTFADNRAFGEPESAVEVPTLSRWSTVVLALLLLLAAARFLWR